MRCRSCGMEFEGNNIAHDCKGFQLNSPLEGEEVADVMQSQVGGDHYKKKTIQPWHIVDEYELDFYEGNALKYLLRDKSNTDSGKRKEDLEKCVHYLQKKLTEWEENPNQGTLDLGTDE